MAKAKHIDIICIASLVVMLALTILFMFGERIGITVIKSGEEAASSVFTANDLNGDWDTVGATKIVLENDSAVITGNGAYFSENTLYIAYAGKYIITGELSGSVEIDSDSDGKIWLMFDGVDILSDSTAPLYIKQADKVFLTLKEGSENTLTFTSGDEDETVDGTVYSKDDLTVNGSGHLTVVSENLHGIVCNDTLVFAGVSIDITAKNDGVHAHDAIKICNASVTVKAGGDGLHAGNDDETSVFYMESGTVDITDCYEGIEANDVTVAGGVVCISSEDDGINANGEGKNSLITVSGGDITIINDAGRDADGLDSNGSINITGGSLLISVVGTGSNCAIDYGSENGGKFTISGGTVIACGGSQMFEGPESDSAQGFITQTVSGNAGDTVELTDKNGKTVLTKEIPCSFASIILSSPEIAVGDTLTLKIGDTETEITVDNSTAGGMGGMGGMKDFAHGGRGDAANQAPFASGGDISGSELPDENGEGTPPEKPDMNGGFFGGQDIPDGESGDVPPFGNKNDLSENGGTPPDAISGATPTPNESSNQGDIPERGNIKNPDMAETPRGDVARDEQPEDSAISADTLLMLAASVAVLAVGLLVAVKLRY